LHAFQARDPERFAQMLGRIPLGRFGDAEVDIGRTVAWLVSDHARYMTGCTIMLDGGQMYLR
jgi:NAD(P)-dependent dehydrogenase (short-subunit alcohol dehydrogenase family)